VVRLAKKQFQTAWDNLRTLLEDHALAQKEGAPQSMGPR